VPAAVKNGKTMAFRPRTLIGKIALVSVTVVLGAAVLLALPPVQGALVRAASSNIPGVDIALDYVRAGPGGLVARGARISGGDFELTIREVELDIAFWASLTGLVLDIESAIITDADLRLTVTPADAGAATPAAGPETGDRAPFSGLYETARLPPWLRLRALDANGDVTVAIQDGIDMAAPWTLEMHDWAAGSNADARLSTTIDISRAAELIATARLDATASAALDGDARLSRLEITADAVPTNAANSVRLDVTADIAQSDEHYALTLDSSADIRLLRADGALSNGRLEGDWNANVSPGVIAAFARGRSVADLAGTSAGRVTLDLAAATADIQSTAHLEGRGWDAFDPRLANLGNLSLDLVLDARAQARTIDAETLELRLASDSAGELLSIESMQPLGIDRDTWRIEPSNPDASAMRLTLHDMPLQRLGDLVSDVNIVAGELSGELRVARSASGATELIAAEPLRARGLVLEPVDGVPRAVPMPAIDLTLVPRVTVVDGTVDAQIEQLSLTAATGLAVEFTGAGRTSRGTWPVARFDGNVTANVPALTRIVPQLDNVHATTRLDFDFSSLTLIVQTAALGVRSASGHDFLALDLSGQRPLSITLPTFAADWSSFDPKAATLRLDRVPVDWLSPYLPELELRGGELSGLLTAAAGGGSGLRLETDEPLTVTDLLPVYRGRPARQPVTASLRPRLSLSNESSSFSLEELTIRLPSGDTLTGELDIESTAGDDSIAVSLQLDANFPMLAASLGAQLGTLQLRQRARLNPVSRRFTLETFTATLAEPGGETIVRLENLRPFIVAAEPFGVSVDGGAPEILRATVTPLRLEQLVPRAMGLDLEGVLPEGEFVGRVESDGGVVLAADEPLVFRDVSVRWQDATLLDRVAMGVTYELAYSADGFEARSVDLRATDSADRLLVHASTEVIAPLRDNRWLERARTTIEAELAPLTNQPVLAGMPRFTDGVFSLTLDVEQAAETTFSVGAALERAAANGVGELPDVDFGFQAAGVRGERVAIVMPLRIESTEHGASDLRFEGTSERRSAESLDFTAMLTGGRLVISDIERLLTLVIADEVSDSNEPAVQPGAATDSRTAVAKLRTDRHTEPVWTTKLTGNAAVAIDEVEFSTFSVADLRGRLDMSPEQLSLSDFGATLFGAAAGAMANVEFDAENAKPYALDLEMDVDGFDIGAFFLAVAPDTPPTWEGIFDLDAEFASSGLNPIDLGLSTLGEVRLAGRDGVFRGLAASAGVGSVATRAIGILTFSREFRALSRLLDGMGEINFNTADLTLDREGGDELTLSTMLIVSPQLRLDASGMLALDAGQPLLLSPIELTAQLAANGDVAVLFDGMELLEDESGSAGYRAVTQPISISGSPAEPDASSFWNLLGEGADNARGTFGMSLRFLNRRLRRTEETD
jgi:hypothetical protein